MTDRTFGGPERTPTTPAADLTSGAGLDGAAAAAMDGAKDAVDRARRQAETTGRDTLGEAKGRVRAIFEAQTHRAADQLDTVAQAIHSAAEQLQDENAGVAARYTEQAAHRVGEVADLIRHSTVDDVVGRVEGFARRNPEIFLGAAFGVGLLFARFVKSSAQRRDGYGRRYTSAREAGYGGYGPLDQDQDRPDMGETAEARRAPADLAARRSPAATAADVTAGSPVAGSSLGAGPAQPTKPQSHGPL